MTNLNPPLSQEQIIEVLCVNPGFDSLSETKKRIHFLSQYLQSTGLKTYILGISGGIDSTVAGRLAQLAVEQLRKNNYACEFIAVRLPYGKQIDEAEAQAALTFIKPDKVMNINIKAACDATLQSLLDGTQQFTSESQQDFILGNIKARQRMIVQYALAGSSQGLVIGTDHAAEAVMGFFTKYGDGASDIVPLYGLNKRRVKSIAAHLNAPQFLIEKKPTADLENLRPQRLDEDAYGVTYNEIDDFLEGKTVSEETYNKILTAYRVSEHKRNLPIMPV